MADPIDTLAELLAENKLVPFFGAGISRAHLGFDAAELAREMAIEIGVPDTTPLSQVSDLFVGQKGEATFISFLRGKLVVAALDDSKAMTHTLAQGWFRGFDAVHSAMRDNVEAMIKDAWTGQQNIPMPQKHGAGPFEPKGFHEILSDIRGHFPKAMKGPKG